MDDDWSDLVPIMMIMSHGIMQKANFNAPFFFFLLVKSALSKPGKKKTSIK
jgi:hypothetical protein